MKDLKEATRHLLFVLICLLAACAPADMQEAEMETDEAAEPVQNQSEEERFVSLFNGEDLEGWHRHMDLPGDEVGGKWEVQDGVIVGDQDPPGAGGFLVTDEKYRDFILKLETKLDYPADSGIFLRIGEDGKSHQVTLDNRSDGDIGAIYLPWTQGMVRENPEGEKVFKQDEWNEVQVQIEGEPAHIRFWLNGELVTDFQHTEETSKGVPHEGFIGLQVHPGPWEEGVKVRFRNIRVQPLNE